MQDDRFFRLRIGIGHGVGGGSVGSSACEFRRFVFVRTNRGQRRRQIETGGQPDFEFGKLLGVMA